MKRRALGLGGGLLLATLLGFWWWTRLTPPVTEAEARTYLTKIVAAVQARDFDRMCRLNGAVSNCETQLQMAGTDTVPTEPPRVAGTRYHRKERGGTAGRVLIVEGIDGRGTPYRTEVFVFRENRYSFKAINAVYWSNFGFGANDIATPDESAPSSGHT